MGGLWLPIFVLDLFCPQVSLSLFIISAILFFCINALAIMLHSVVVM